MIQNDKSRKGQLAGERETFGEFSRYAIGPVHTRFDAVEWFVWDAETIDPVTGGPAVVGQGKTREHALKFLSGF